MFVVHIILRFEGACQLIYSYMPETLTLSGVGNYALPFKEISSNDSIVTKQSA